MKVLYDYQAFSWQKWGGISNCFVKLLESLPTDVHYEIAIKETDNVHLKESNLCSVQPCRLTGDNFLTSRFFPGKYRLYRWFMKLFPKLTTSGINALYAKELLERQDFDIFHPTFFDSYFLKYLGNKPFVLTIHDMIPELMYKGNDDPQIAAKRLLAPLASKIVAVSNNTKNDIIKVLKVPEEKVDVVYHGAPQIVDYPKEKIFSFDYLLFVGGRNQPYKNFQPMIKSLAPVLAERKNLYLVCTGKQFSKAEIQLFESLNIKNKVIHRFCSSERDLMNLYHNAICFIFPSLYEGFGIPILEAFNVGCPVLLNRKSCFPEIAGDAAIYFILDNKDDNLRVTLENFFDFSDAQKSSLREKGLQRVKKFNWKKSAEDLADVYKSVLGKG